MRPQGDCRLTGGYGIRPYDCRACRGGACPARNLPANALLPVRCGPDMSGPYRVAVNIG